MSQDPISKAREFVTVATLPEAPPLDRKVAKSPAAAFTAAKDQAAVVGSELISFVRGVSAERRQDVVNAALLAQLVAKTKVPHPKSIAEIEAWYEAYFDALANIGFAIQDKGFARYSESGEGFEVHEAILEVAGAVLAGSPAALALVKTTLGALQKMSTDSSWITLFNRESQSARTAHFQVSLVEEDEHAGFLVSLFAFGLEANANLTQVLFFKFHSNDVTLYHQSGKVTINDQVLTSVRGAIAGKLIAYAADYIQALPDLGPVTDGDRELMESSPGRREDQPRFGDSSERNSFGDRSGVTGRSSAERERGSGGRNTPAGSGGGEFDL